MCGIAGCFGGAGAEEVVLRVTDRIRHRGPDDFGISALRDPQGRPAGALGHRRLSILDLSPAGHQPMHTADGRYSLVFNGEIYNFRELRGELEREGESFRSGSDTEVLLAGWARHGSAFVRRLRGMFAFALWDRERGCGWLVRDAFGIKPLYVAVAGERVVFASEVRAVLAAGLTPRRLCGEAVASFLATGSVAEPYTIAQGVRALPAGSLMRVEVRDGAARLSEPELHTPLWPTDGVEPVQARDGAARLVRDALRESVAYHLVSDVPVAFFLSGGIDSSAMVALASEASSGRLETFTVVFPEQEFSEAGPARAVAERFRSTHHEIPLSGEDFLHAIPAAFAAMDQPSMDGLNTYVVSGAVRERGIKVVISGLGGDELFAGYPSFRRARTLAPLWGAPTGGLRRAAARAVRSLGGMRGSRLAAMLREGDPAHAAYRASRTLFPDPLVQALHGSLPSARRADPPRALPLLQRVSWLELSGYMRNTLLRDSDVFSMAHSLELRVPFVDRGVVAAAHRVHDRLKLTGRTAKPVLVDAVRDLLPREVWDRPKQGFVLPFARWMRGPLRAEVESSLVAARLARTGLDPAAARGIWEGFAGEGSVSWSRPWSLYTLVRWAEENDLSLEPSAQPAWPEPLVAGRV